ncbi:MAG: phosphatase domain-containing protein [Cyanobacteria bacterium P01_H01_bin.21]
MVDWISSASKMMGAVNQTWDSAKHHVNQKLGIQDAIHILPYRGYGTAAQLWLKGRVLQNEDIALREKDDPIWKNALNMYRRFETDEIPGVQIRASVGNQQCCITTNKEGFFEVEIDLQQRPDSLWQPVQLEILTDDYPISSQKVQGEAIIVSEKTRFGVISDIDDTVVRTAATDLFKMIRIAYLGNEQTRQPFAGVASFYHALQRGSTGQASNPIFYVSSSAWNMYDLFDKFMSINNIPKGPILLRDIELSPENLLSFEHSSHKLEQICPVLEQFSELPFILIGDTGQQDAEIYRTLAQNYPDRILAIYLRDVVPDNRDRTAQLSEIGDSLQQQGIPFLVFAKTSAAVEHAADHGWVLPRLPFE